VDASLSPTPLIINQISNTGIAYVGIYGTEKPAYYLASLDPNATCKGMAGEAIGVDTPGGATSIALKNMLASCGLSIKDVQQVALSANVPSAMIAGQLKHGILHLDGVIAVEDQTGKKINPVVDYLAVRPVYHNMLVVVRRDKLAENRDRYVRIVAGLIAAERFMHDPANYAAAAKIAAPTGRTEKQAEEAVKRYVEIGFWPHDAAGLTKANIEAVEEEQVKVGNIRPGKTPVAYEDLVDPSIYKDAMEMVDKAQ
jgi:ABC-type nitrate/sulfonate/bicarbonate transport system substrate-binding protein